MHVETLCHGSAGPVLVMLLCVAMMHAVGLCKTKAKRAQDWRAFCSEEASS